MVVSCPPQDSKVFYLYPMQKLFRGVVSELVLDQCRELLDRAEMRFLMTLPRKDLGKYRRKDFLGSMALALHTLGVDNRGKIEQAADLVFRRLNGLPEAQFHSSRSGLDELSGSTNLSLPKEGSSSQFEKSVKKRENSLTDKDFLRHLNDGAVELPLKGRDCAGADVQFSSCRQRLLVFHPECQVFVKSPSPESPWQCSFGVM